MEKIALNESKRYFATSAVKKEKKKKWKNDQMSVYEQKVTYW